VVGTRKTWRYPDDYKNHTPVIANHSPASFENAALVFQAAQNFTMTDDIETTIAKR
jgi:hypothetical protein